MVAGRGVGRVHQFFSPHSCTRATGFSLTTAALTGVVCLFSLGVSLKLNFRNYTDEDEPYVYVQTLPQINALLDPLQKLAGRDPENYFLTGHFIGTEQYPFCWLLADYPLVDYLPSDALPEEPDADFLVVDETLVEKIEPKLRNSYLRVPLRLRGFSSDSEVLYLNPGIFAPFLPKDTARFTPGPAETGKRTPETGEKGSEGISAALKCGRRDEERDAGAGLIVGARFLVGGFASEKSGHERGIAAERRFQFGRGHRGAFDAIFRQRGGEVPSPEQRALPMPGFLRITIGRGITKWRVTQPL